MSSFTFLLLCIQACLIQTVFSQALYGLPGYANSVANNLAGLSGNGVAVGGGSLAVGSSSLGLANSGLGLVNSGLGLVNSGLGLANSGFGNAGYVASSGYSAVPDVAAVTSLPVMGPYGGVGYAEMAVGGDVSAAGTTIVTGQIPVLGAVSFGGNVPAGGVVSIAGNCGCGGLVF